ncbi:MAG: DUF4164 domain-containing protein [Hyphomonadaceae bacterium]|nr:DUF4164 domain-containing protein [Hyphomonadaceae bacterium]
MDQLETASQRLDKAMKRLEGTLESLIEQAREPVALRRERDALLVDRDELAERLEAALSREIELEGLTEEASGAIGTAIEEVRAALGQDE